MESIASDQGLKKEVFREYLEKLALFIHSVPASLHPESEWAILERPTPCMLIWTLEVLMGCILSCDVHVMYECIMHMLLLYFQTNVGAKGLDIMLHPFLACSEHQKISVRELSKVG